MYVRSCRTCNTPTCRRLPAAVRQDFTALAAGGQGLVMCLAAVVHTRLHEPKNVAINLLLLAACVFVALGRS